MSCVCKSCYLTLVSHAVSNDQTFSSAGQPICIKLFFARKMLRVMRNTHMAHFQTTFPAVWQYPLAQLSGKLKFLWTVQPEVLLNTYRKIPKISPLPLKDKPSERNAHTTHLRMRFDQSRRQSSLFVWSAPSTQILIDP